MLRYIGQIRCFTVHERIEVRCVIPRLLAAERRANELQARAASEGCNSCAKSVPICLERLVPASITAAILTCAIRLISECDAEPPGPSVCNVRRHGGSRVGRRRG